MVTTKIATRAVASVALAAGLTACATISSTSALSDQPQGIVISNGGVVQILHDTTAASPRQVAGADAGGMTDVRQIDSHTVAGLRGGDLVSFDPAQPEDVRTIATAYEWFPAATGDSAWVVTETGDQPSCPAISGTPAGTVRYQLERRDLQNGSVQTPVRALPCRMHPVADTSAGLLVDTLHNQAETNSDGHSGSVPADIQLLDRDSLQTRRTVQANANVVAAAADTVVASRNNCSQGVCTTLQSLDGKSTPELGSLPQGGTLAPNGILDAGGRYLASAANTPDGYTELVVCDLSKGTVADLGPYKSLSPGATQQLTEEMPAVWSGTRLLIIDPQNNTLTSYQTTIGKIATRHGFAANSRLQVWGASS